MKAVQLDKPPYLRMLIYGDSGSGKTRLMGTSTECEHTSPLLVLNARGQPISLRHVYPHPCILTIESMKDFNNIYQWLSLDQKRDVGVAKQPEIKYCIQYLDDLGAEKFKTLGLDSITHVQRISMDDIAGKADRIGDTPRSTQIQHWGMVLSQLTRVADEFYKLPLNVIITALARHDHVETLGTTMYYPFLWGQSSLEVPSHAELVARLLPIASMQTRKVAQLEKAFENVFQDEDPFNVLLTRGGRNFVAKWQGPENPPSVVVAPTIQKVVDVMRE